MNFLYISNIIALLLCVSGYVYYRHYSIKLLKVTEHKTLYKIKSYLSLAGWHSHLSAEIFILTNIVTILLSFNLILVNIPYKMLVALLIIFAPLLFYFIQKKIHFNNVRKYLIKILENLLITSENNMEYIKNLRYVAMDLKISNKKISQELIILLKELETNLDQNKVWEKLDKKFVIKELSLIIQTIIRQNKLGVNKTNILISDIKNHKRIRQYNLETKSQQIKLLASAILLLVTIPSFIVILLSDKILFTINTVSKTNIFQIIGRL